MVSADFYTRDFDREDKEFDAVKASNQLPCCVNTIPRKIARMRKVTIREFLGSNETSLYYIRGYWGILDRIEAGTDIWWLGCRLPGGIRETSEQVIVDYRW